MINQSPDEEECPCSCGMSSPACADCRARLGLGVTDRSIRAGQLWRRSSGSNFKLVRVLDVEGIEVAFQDVCGGPDEHRAEQCFQEEYRLVPVDPKNLTFSGTGHRPEKLARFGPVLEIRERVRCRLVQLLRGLRPVRVISGMAPGFDQWLAWACVEAEIPWYAAVPYAGQEHRWSAAAQREYHELLTRAAAPPIVLAPSYRPRSGNDLGTFELRNRWMIDYSDVVLACYLGFSGGTQNAVRYATAQQRSILNINNPSRLPQ